ncbi:MAG: hypothetical protein AB7K68_13445 [Bacteriovoracia bacterium]
MTNFTSFAALCLAFSAPAFAADGYNTINPPLPTTMTDTTGAIRSAPTANPMNSNVTTDRNGVRTRDTLGNRKRMRTNRNGTSRNLPTTNPNPGASSQSTDMGTSSMTNRNPAFPRPSGVGSNANGTTGTSGADASGANNPGMSPPGSGTGNSSASDSSGLDTGGSSTR